MPVLRVRVLKQCAFILVLVLFVYIWYQSQTDWIYKSGRDIPSKGTRSKLEIRVHKTLVVNDHEVSKITTHPTRKRGHGQYIAVPKFSDRHVRKGIQSYQPYRMKMNKPFDGRRSERPLVNNISERERAMVRQDNETQKTKAKNSLNKVSPQIRKVEQRQINPKEVKQILANIQNWFHVRHESEKDALLNRHEFVYHLNSKVCNGDINILIFVHSAPNNIEKRNDIRDTWGSVQRHGNLSIATVFMCGETTDRALQEQLIRESGTYGDIVQGNILDSYRNLTYKHVMALCWITSQCHDVRTVVKVDDDVLINIFKLVSYSVQIGHYHNNLYCSAFQRGKPKRDTSDKWYTPEEQYPFELYPPYCEGLAYMTSVDEVKALCKASEDTKFYWVDDTFVTGILAQKAGLSLSSFKGHHEYVKNGRDHHTSFQSVLFFLEYKNWTSLWQNVVKIKNMF